MTFHIADTMDQVLGWALVPAVQQELAVAS